MDSFSYDHIVVGLGALGSATARHLAVRGESVLGLEQFRLGHNRGESEDHSRIIRLTYHTPAYAQLAQAAYKSWEELEVMTGQPVVNTCGCLEFYPEGAALSLEDFVANTTAAGEQVEVLTAAEVGTRWPQFALEKSTRATYHAKGGFVMASRANAVNRQLAIDHGAELRDECPVIGLEVDASGVTVWAGGEKFRARSVIIAAGPWTNPVIAHLDRQFPLTVTQEQVSYFTPTNPLPFHASRFPVWIWMDDPSIYGFPIFGAPATKAAIDAGGMEVTGDTRSFDVDPENSRIVRDFVHRLIPGYADKIFLEKTCLYTLPPDRDFILDRLPGYDRVMVAVGAGHAFKFASVIGEIMADLAMKGDTPHDISPFSATRPILAEREPAKNFLI